MFKWTQLWGSYIICMFSIFNNKGNVMFIATSKLTNAETSSLEEINECMILSNKSSTHRYLYIENYFIFYIATVNVH